MPATNIKPSVRPKARPTDLAAMLWSEADQADVAEVLRLRDEVNANKMAELLCMMIRAIPMLNRVAADGHDAETLEFEAGQRRRLLGHAPPTTSDPMALDAWDSAIKLSTANEVKYRTLAANKRTATEWLRQISRLAPSLFVDQVASEKPATGKVDSQTSTEAAVEIVNFHITNKLDYVVIDGWPTSLHKRDEPRGVVKLVTVAEKGLRT